MERIPFRSLPLVVRLATMVTWFLSWVLFAELVIDRYEIGPLLPLYRVGDVCLWDLAVLALLGGLWMRLHR